MLEIKITDRRVSKGTIYATEVTIDCKPCEIKYHLKGLLKALESDEHTADALADAIQEIIDEAGK